MQKEVQNAETISRVIDAASKGFMLSHQRFDDFQKHISGLLDILESQSERITFLSERVTLLGDDMLDIIEAQGKRISLLSERLNLLEEK